MSDFLRIKKAPQMGGLKYETKGLLSNPFAFVILNHYKLSSICVVWIAIVKIIIESS